jgi:hypothetical protein
VGNFKNNGKEWRPNGTPERVNIHDFIDPRLSRAVPYGVYDITNNVGWVSVGTDHDTAAFAVNAIRRWWRTMGRKRHPNAKRLMITADASGSNGYRVRLWKVELQRLADELKLPITVCHLPHGTRKWNKIKHRLFSFITINWRGKPLRSYRTIVQLIAATIADTGFKVRAELDEKNIPAGIRGRDTQVIVADQLSMPSPLEPAVAKIRPERAFRSHFLSPSCSRRKGSSKRSRAFLARSFAVSTRSSRFSIRTRASSPKILA